jgi:hypothetical protein
MKKRTNNIIKGVVFSIGLLSAIACSEGLDSNLNNPSALTPEQASNEFVWNGVQLGFSNFFLNVTDFGQDITRMRNMAGSIYENAYTQNSFNGIWLSAYSDVMVNANLLLTKTTENPSTTEVEYNPFYQGTAKVMKAYVLMTLVDYFGDVPYAEAFNTNNFNPVAQDGAVVYDSVQNLLESAVVDLNAVTSGTPKPAYDLYYSADPAGWRKAANSLLFKLHLNRRLIDPTGSDAAMAALIAGGDMINSNAEDFSFKYTANSQNNPNTYHPWFYGSYLTSSGPYMSNSYMKELYDGKGIADPRIRYYFYRQVNQPTGDVNELTCSIPDPPYTTFPPAHYPAGAAYCQLPDGYWGRDHLNFEGTPPDGLKKTTYGLYPAGGRFDANDAVPVTDQGLASGGKGKGILPIMMSSFVLFMRAEHALTKPAPDPVGAGNLLDQAVRRSIDKVVTFIPDAVTDFAPSAGTINNYVSIVLNRYNTASTSDAKLEVICKEYWVALWGNGVESYNMYRRTGHPSPATSSNPTGMQPALAANPGNFYRSFTYPGVYVNRNSNAVQKENNKVKVFWDTNPDGFIN